MKLRLLAVLALCIAGRAMAAAPPSETVALTRADGSRLETTVFDRRSGPADRALLVVAGSDCKRASAQRWIGQVVSGATPRWVVVVEKPGATDDGACGPTYEAHATEEARWFDTLTAMHALKARLHLRREGAFQVLAISAGGLTGCAVAGATSDVGALALLSTGGGITFSEELDRTFGKHPRVLAQRDRVLAHPVVGQTWLGDTNPEIWWWSVLPKRCTPLLAGFRGPVLILHGAKDDDVPLLSATSLRDGLRAEGMRADLRVLPTAHDLGLSALPEGQNGVAQALDWLKTAR